MKDLYKADVYPQTKDKTHIYETKLSFGNVVVCCNKCMLKYVVMQQYLVNI